MQLIRTGAGSGGTGCGTGKARRGYAGFTLVELAVVMTVFAIVMARGIPAIVDYLDNSALRRAASDLHHAASVARSEAVKRNIRTELRVTASGWSIYNMSVDPAALLRSGTLDPRASATPLTLDFASNGRTFPAGTQATVNVSMYGASCSDVVRCPAVRITSGGSAAVCDPTKTAGAYGACS